MCAVVIQSEFRHTLIAPVAIQELKHRPHLGQLFPQRTLVREIRLDVIQPGDLSLRCSQDLLAVAECDLAKCLNVHLGVNLSGIRRSVPNEVSDRLEREPGIDKPLNAGVP